MADAYRELVTEIDEMTARLTSRYREHLQCQAGCSGCCQHHLSLFKVEADTILDVILRMPVTRRVVLESQAREVRERETNGLTVTCPLLLNDRCSIYESRPIICRTQGLPLLMTSDDGTEEVDWCPLNFTSKNAVEDLEENHLLPLDEVNTRLTLTNLLHCRAQGITDTASGDRVDIADIILNAAGIDRAGSVESGLENSPSD